MDAARTVAPGRLRRLAEELVDEDLGVLETVPAPGSLLDELDYALRPPSHEGRVPGYGAVVVPTLDPDAWAEPTTLTVDRRRIDDLDDDYTRRFADGLSSWAVRHEEGITELVVFDRSAGSERDLVVIAAVADATLVQRHPSGTVRIVGSFGVVRWDGTGWHQEPPLAAWLPAVGSGRAEDERRKLESLLQFAVHDLGARGIGALLVLGPGQDPPPFAEQRLPVPPPLCVARPPDLAPLRHVLAQVDGAAVFDRSGTLRHLGVRLVPSTAAEADVDAYRGTRHTSARRYSYDDPEATVVAVSEDGPVTVLRGGELVARSLPT